MMNYNCLLAITVFAIVTIVVSGTFLSSGAHGDGTLAACGPNLFFPGEDDLQPPPIYLPACYQPTQAHACCFRPSCVYAGEECDDCVSCVNDIGGDVISGVRFVLPPSSGKTSYRAIFNQGGDCQLTVRVCLEDPEDPCGWVCVDAPQQPDPCWASAYEPFGLNCP